MGKKSVPDGKKVRGSMCLLCQRIVDVEGLSRDTEVLTQGKPLTEKSA
jgi:hypothetical protein